MRDAGLPADTLAARRAALPAAALGVDLADTLDALARAELLFVTPDRRAVLGIGIGAMLGRDTDVASADPRSGEPVTASGRGGQWAWEPAGAVVFVGSSGEGRITDACCPVINFFASKANPLDYQRSHGLTGEVLAVPEAAQAGALVFGGLLADLTP